MSALGGKGLGTAYQGMLPGKRQEKVKKEHFC
jgi:hypothetical protein